MLGPGGNARPFLLPCVSIEALRRSNARLWLSCDVLQAMTDNTNRNRLRILPAFATVTVFAIALSALHRLTGEFNLDDILAAAADISRSGIAAAVAYTIGSYVVLMFYDVLALRHVSRRLPYGQVALTSFMAYAIGHNVGVVAFSAGAIRYRMYSLAGLSAGEIAQIVAFCAVTFDLGAGLLIGISLVGEAGQAASLLHASPVLATVLGAAVLSAVAAYLMLTVFRREPITVRSWSLPLPPWPMTLAQLAVSAADLILACAALYALLPAGTEVSFVAFAGLYMVAMVAGAMSTVPGGLGVFESVLILLLPSMPVHQLLGALLAYRVIYYVLPFAAAIALLTGHEFWRQRHRVRVAWHWTRRSLDFVVPQAMSVLAFGAGVILLISGATPAVGERISALQNFLPLSVLELSHLAGSAIGVALLVLARGLYYRLDAAWHLMVWLLGAGIAVSLLKGLDYEEATLLLAVLLPLVVTRREFYRRASLLAEPLAPRWLAAVAMAIGASIWIGLLAHSEIPYQQELWWQFAFDASAPRMMRASLVAVLGLGIVAAYRLLLPPRPRAEPPTPSDLQQAEAIVRTADSTAANLALLGDKSLLFSESGTSFVMYGVSGRSWVAMGDPVGTAAERGELVWQFRETCDREGGWCAFYEVAPVNLPLYVDAGLSLSKLGEEARVPLAEFSLDGHARAPLRQAHRKAEREGAGFRVALVAEIPALLPRLRAVSDEWLAAKGVAEKGFSLGYFDERYLRHFPIAIVSQGGKTVAFANIWANHGCGELSIDLMRYANDAPKGVMDYLFVELMLWGKAQGYRWFSLGMAPLAGLEEHRLAPAWHKLGRLLYRYGENFYNFEGLRHYKDKFQPEWRPRYLAAPGGMALPRVLLDVTALISGGPRAGASPRTRAAA